MMLGIWLGSAPSSIVVDVSHDNGVVDDEASVHDLGRAAVQRLHNNFRLMLEHPDSIELKGFA